MTKHGSFLTDLELEGDFRNLRDERSLVSYCSRRLKFAIQARLPDSLIRQMGLHHFTAKEVGWAPSHELLRPGSVIRGEFFTTRYYRKLVSLGHAYTLQPRNPSPTYIEKASLLSKSRFLSIHVRRGDYVGLSTTFGLLGEEYFRVAVHRLVETGAEWDQIVVFSDDIELARQILSSALKGEKVEFLDPLFFSKATEDLSLMSLASYAIISNSSFSLWAAMASRNLLAAVAPEPWFKSKPEPASLVPEYFLRAPSAFS